MLTASIRLNHANRNLQLTTHNGSEPRSLKVRPRPNYVPLALCCPISQSGHSINRIGHNKIPRIRVIVHSVLHDLPNSRRILGRKIPPTHLRRARKTRSNHDQICILHIPASLVSVDLQVKTMISNSMMQFLLSHLSNLRRRIDKRQCRHIPLKDQTKSHLATNTACPSNCNMHHQITSIGK